MAKTRIALLIAALTVLVACGGSAEPAKKKAPPPPKVYTAAQLQAALPGVKDVPDGKEETSKCPGGDRCAKPKDGATWSKEFSLDLPFTGVEAEKAAQSGIPDFTTLEVIKGTTALTAAGKFTEARKARSKYDGSFEEKAKKSKEGFTFGLDGTGTRKNIKVSGWSGYLSVRDFTLTNLKGGNEGKMVDTELRVQSGPVTVLARVGSGQGKRSADECEKLTRKLVSDYLARLG